MKRTDRTPPEMPKPDISELLRATMFLDEALKRGVVVGIFEGSMEVSDEDIHRACTAVRQALVALTTDLDRMLATASRVVGLPESTRLQ